MLKLTGNIRTYEDAVRIVGCDDGLSDSEFFTYLVYVENYSVLRLEIMYDNHYEEFRSLKREIVGNIRETAKRRKEEEEEARRQKEEEEERKRIEDEEAKRNCPECGAEFDSRYPSSRYPDLCDTCSRKKFMKSIGLGD